MNFTINDLSLCNKLDDEYKAINCIQRFLRLIRQLKKTKILTGIYSDRKFSGWELAPQYYLEHVLNDNRLTKEERLFLKTVLANCTKIEPDRGYLFEIDGTNSTLLAYSYLNNFFVLSIETKDIFTRPYLDGILKNNSNTLCASLANISSVEHLDIHKKNLGIRVYENNPKHKVNYGWGSPMDLPDDIAQKVLQEAIPVLNNYDHLVNFYNKKYYSFRRHHENCFHGYIDNTLPENVKSLLNHQCKR